MVFLIMCVHYFNIFKTAPRLKLTMVFSMHNLNVQFINSNSENALLRLLKNKVVF